MSNQPVKRYNHMVNRDSSDGAWYAETYEADDGIFVLASDHETLETRLKNQSRIDQEQRTRMQGVIDRLVDERTTLETRCAELEADLAVNRKIRRYVAFVLAGDEEADVQLAADMISDLRTSQAETIARLQDALEWIRDTHFTGKSESRDRIDAALKEK